MKKSAKNLEVTKKSSNFAPGIALDKSRMVFEKCSSVPAKSWKPGEAMSIREMLIRSERGQRLGVNTRFRAENIPDNMYPMEFERVKDQNGNLQVVPKHDDKEDTFDHTPPDGVNDIVDILRLQEEMNERKAALKRSKSAKKPQEAPSQELPKEETKVPKLKPEEDERGRKDE